MHTIVWSPHPYIPTCGQSLRFNCCAAEGVTEECTLRVLLLTIGLYFIVPLNSINFTSQIYRFRIEQKLKVCHEEIM